MALYAKYVGNSASADDYNSVALVFERDGAMLEAGRFYVKVGQLGVKVCLYSYVLTFVFFLLFFRLETTRRATLTRL
jgi:hypothetical protein